MASQQVANAGQQRVKRTFGEKRVSVTRLCPCTPDVGRVHENWAKSWYGHVILAKKRSAGQQRVKRTFGQKRVSVTRLCRVHENWAKTCYAHVILA